MIVAKSNPLSRLSFVDSRSHFGWGKPIHYSCNESADWQPDIDDIRSKITNKTRAIVIINPNNSTDAVYSKETLESISNVARDNDLTIYSDEVYDKVLYDQANNIPIATLSDDIFLRHLWRTIEKLSRRWISCRLDIFNGY